MNSTALNAERRVRFRQCLTSAPTGQILRFEQRRIEPHRVCRKLQLLSSNCVSGGGFPVRRSGLRHRIENCQQLAGAGYDDQLSRFSDCDEALFEGPEDWIEPADGEGCEIEAPAARSASAPDAALAASLSRVICVGRQSGEGRDPSSIKLIKLRKLRDQNGRDNGSDPLHAAKTRQARCAHQLRPFSRGVVVNSPLCNRSC